MSYVAKILSPGETVRIRPALHWVIFIAPALAVLAALFFSTLFVTAPIKESRVEIHRTGDKVVKVFGKEFEISETRDSETDGTPAEATGVKAEDQTAAQDVLKAAQADAGLATQKADDGVVVSEETSRVSVETQSDGLVLTEDAKTYETKVRKIKYAPLAFLSGFAWLVALVLLANALIRWLTTEYAVTNLKAVAKWGLISRKTLEQRLDKVESVSVNQSILGRVLNYGDIVIRGTGMGAVGFSAVKDPLAVRKDLEKLLDEARTPASSNAEA